MLIESNIIIADEVVTFLSARFRCLSITPLQPGKHRLADVDTSVVYDVGLHNMIAVSFHDLSQ